MNNPSAPGKHALRRVPISRFAARDYPSLKLRDEDMKPYQNGRWTGTQPPNTIIVEYYEPTPQPPPFAASTPEPIVVLLRDENNTLWAAIRYWIRPSKKVLVPCTLNF